MSSQRSSEALELLTAAIRTSALPGQRMEAYLTGQSCTGDHPAGLHIEEVAAY